MGQVIASLSLDKCELVSERHQFLRKLPVDPKLFNPSMAQTAWIGRCCKFVVNASLPSFSLSQEVKNLLIVLCKLINSDSSKLSGNILCWVIQVTKGNYAAPMLGIKLEVNASPAIHRQVAELTRKFILDLCNLAICKGWIRLAKQADHNIAEMMLFIQPFEVVNQPPSQDVRLAPTHRPTVKNVVMRLNRSKKFLLAISWVDRLEQRLGSFRGSRIFRRCRHWIQMFRSCLSVLAIACRAR